MNMIRRLTQSETNTGFYAAINLIPEVYANFTQSNQLELIEVLNKVASDQQPPIRKQASFVLNKMIKLIPKAPESELLSIFNKICKDEQDSVRM